MTRVRALIAKRNQSLPASARHLPQLMRIYTAVLLFTAVTFSVSLGQNLPGSNDPTFNTADIVLGAGENFNLGVSSLVTQTDGKVLAGGNFTSFNGTSCKYIARLNVDGTVDAAFNPGTGFNNIVLSLAMQTNGKVLAGGNFTSFNGTSRNYIARLNVDGTLDTGFDPGTGFNNEVTSLAVQEDGKVLVGGSFTAFNGTSRKYIARLNVDGTLDTGFDPGTGFNSTVGTLAVQPDGKVLVGGEFTSFNGMSRNYIARLNSDGTLDTGFDPGTGYNSTVRSLAVQADGKVLVGGDFTSFNGMSRNYIARLNSDGTLDTDFTPGTGFNSSVRSLAVQPDGKLLVGGYFNTFNGTSRKYITRLNTNGTLDTAFNPGSGFSSSVTSLALQPDGKLLVGGWFTTFNGTAQKHIARLNVEGTLDTGFTPPSTGFNNLVLSLAVQPDGKVLVGGWFSFFNGTALNRIARLNADGTLDTAFNPGRGFDGGVNSIALQADGKVLVGGGFSSFDGTARNYIARLNADGTLDATFTPGTGFNNGVNSLAVQADGKVLVGGSFTSFNGTSRNYIARLNTDGTLDMSFDPGTGLNSNVWAMALQPDGKVLLGGQFTSFNGSIQNYIIRLNSDGTQDTGFNTGTGFGSSVRSLAIQSDGRVLAVGDFTTFNGSTRNRIARLNANGTLDTAFNPGSGFNSSVLSLAVQKNGKVLVAGNFISINGTTRNRIDRLNIDGTLDSGFNPGTGFDTSVNSLALQPDGKVLVGGGVLSFNNIPRRRMARLNGDPVCTNPRASFTVGSGCAGTALSFTDQSTEVAADATYAWDIDNDGTVDYTTKGNISHTYPTAGTYTAKLTVRNGTCENSFTATVTVSATSVGGTATAANAAVCAGSGTTISLSGHTGSILWQSSADNSTFTDLAGQTTTNLNTGNLTATTYFRAKLTSGSCTPAYSTVATVTVSAAPSAGTLRGPQSICVAGTTTFSSTIIGGSWSSSNTAIATVNASTGEIMGVAAGTATMTYTVTGTGGCSHATDTRTVTVTAPPSAPTANNTTVTYDGTAKSASATAPVGALVTYYTAATGGTETTAPSATNAGTYTAWAESSLNGCVSATRTQVILTIGKAQLTVTATSQAVPYSTPVTSVTEAGTYTASGFVNNETSAEIGGVVTFTTNYTATTNAGATGVTITPVVTALTATNYSFSAAHGAITIEKASTTIMATGPTSYTYSGAAQGPATSEVNGSTGSVTYSYSGTGNNGEAYGPSATAPTLAGSYSVIGSVSADENHEEASSPSLAFTIRKAAATIKLSVGGPFTADGNPKEATATTAPAGLSGLSITYNGSPTAPSAHGSYLVVASLTNSNYIATDTSGTLIINPSVTTAKATTLALSASPASVQYSDKVTLTATLKEGSNNVAGKVITFSFGTQSGITASGVTNATGVASVIVTVTQPAGVVAISASFAGDADFLTSTSPAATFTISREDANLIYTGDTYRQTATGTTNQVNVQLSGTIVDASDASAGDIRNAKIDFTSDVAIAQSNVEVRGSAASGTASATKSVQLTAAQISAGGNTYEMVAKANGNFYTGAAERTAITVALPGADFATGGGSVNANGSTGTYALGNGSRIYFGFTMRTNRFLKNMAGQVTVLFSRTESGVVNTYRIKSTSIASITAPALDGSFRKSVITSKATLTRISPIGTETVVATDLDLTTDAWEAVSGGGHRIAFKLQTVGSKSVPSSVVFSSSLSVQTVVVGGTIRLFSSISARESFEQEPVSQPLPLQVDLYPNPTGTNTVSVLIKGGTQKPVRLQLVDLTGQVVLQRDLQVETQQHTEVLDVTKVPAGVLLLRVSTAGEQVVKKLLKQ
jgi:uncharacterized delta-60 repeat protein